MDTNQLESETRSRSEKSQLRQELHPLGSSCSCGCISSVYSSRIVGFITLQWGSKEGGFVSPQAKTCFGMQNLDDTAHIGLIESLECLGRCSNPFKSVLKSTKKLSKVSA